MAGGGIGAQLLLIAAISTPDPAVQQRLVLASTIGMLAVLLGALTAATGGAAFAGAWWLWPATE